MTLSGKKEDINLRASRVGQEVVSKGVYSLTLLWFPGLTRQDII